MLGSVSGSVRELVSVLVSVSGVGRAACVSRVLRVEGIVTAASRKASPALARRRERGPTMKGLACQP